MNFNPATAEEMEEDLHNLMHQLDMKDKPDPYPEKSRAKKKKNTVITKLSYHRDDIMTHHWKFTHLSPPTTKAEDTAVLVRIRGLQSYQNAGPEVEICPENRVEINPLDYVNAPIAGERQSGKFLLCRTLCPATNTIWVDTVVDDPNGENGVFLRLSNFTPTKYSKDVVNAEERDLELLPPGSYLAVKNFYPMLRATRNDPQTEFVPLVACMSPADVVLLSPKKVTELFPDLVWKSSVPGGSFWDTLLNGKTDHEVMTALIRKGNEALVFKRFTDALRWYDLASDYAEGNDTDLWSNKAVAFHGLGCFQKALECCEKVLELDPFHHKAIYRKVKALVGLGIEHCSTAMNFINGKLYDRPSLIRNPNILGLREKIPPALNVDGNDLMDFGIEVCGPIEFRPDPINGRGVFAARDIAAGKVTVYTQRAFAKVEAVEGGIDDEDGSQLSGSELVMLIANKITFAPELGPDLYQLWAGPDLKTLEPEDPESRKVHMLRIHRIVQYNVRYSSNCLLTGTNHPKQSWAWWITLFMGHVNHSCTGANTENRHYNNWTFIRATKAIKKGEEILTHWVYPWIDSFESRKDELRQRGMTCNCDLCERDAKDGPDVKRKFQKLFNRFHAKSTQMDFLQCSRQKLDSALAIVDQMANLRKDAPHLNTVMMSAPITSLCDALYKRKDMYLDTSVEKYLELAEQILVVAEALNNLDLVISLGISMINGYLKLRKVLEAADWAKKVKKYTTQVYGKNRKIFNWDPNLRAKMKAAGIVV